MVGEGGLEPPLREELDPKSSASANSATHPRWIARLSLSVTREMRGVKIVGQRVRSRRAAVGLRVAFFRRAREAVQLHPALQQLLHEARREDRGGMRGSIACHAAYELEELGITRQLFSANAVGEDQQVEICRRHLANRAAHIMPTGRRVVLPAEGENSPPCRHNHGDRHPQRFQAFAERSDVCKRDAVNDEQANCWCRQLPIRPFFP